MNAARGKGTRARDVLLVVGAVLMAPLLAVASPAQAGVQTFTVNSTLDPGVGAGCDATECSLREAIEAANASPGRDTIEFEFPGNGAAQIQPLTPLPDLDDPVTIDGYEDSGAAPNSVPLAKDGSDAVLTVILDGTVAGAAASALVFAAGAENSLVRGLAIGHFSTEALDVRADGVAIEGNFVGTTAAGTAAASNDIGVLVLANGVTVGGTNPAQRNLIAANVIGLNIAEGQGVAVQGNLIGTAKNGVDDLGNQIGLILFNGAKKATVGGTTDAAANVIAFSDEEGVRVVGNAGNGNRILRNSIFQNGQLGIDLNDDGITPNAPKDPDTGPNRLQNFPELTSATLASGETTIKGKLNSTPDTKFTVQFFASPFSFVEFEGKTFLGQKSVTTNKKGKASFTFTTDAPLIAGDLITATATNKKKRDTSEFSGPAAVVAG